LPENLRHTADDANNIPYPDDFFDVVISWGSVEHIYGGYLQTLNEIKRVLRPDGLLFIHPGLYYGNFGHHLGEFSTEPFFHLTKSEEEIKELVLSKDPELMDRSGYQNVSREDFWRYYTELNPIAVLDFERELRALDFEFYRAALRTEERIEYTHPKMQNYPVQDLSTLEFYLSAYNRKNASSSG
jgi:SAM-dependent methyltransferase